jgi:hypothetical protein
MNCKLEQELKCGAGWRNSVFSVTPFTPEDQKVKDAKEINESIKSIIKDIDDARQDV